MSREIKFRAWDKRNSEWVEITAGSARGEEGRIPITSLIVYNAEDECELMQYTGLKDKNGVEIYEGDIVQINHPYKDRSYTGDVTYDRYAFTVDGFDFPHFDTPSDIFSEGTDYIEVIGNIYENKELLNVEGV